MIYKTQYFFFIVPQLSTECNWCRIHYDPILIKNITFSVSTICCKDYPLTLNYHFNFVEVNYSYMLDLFLNSPFCSIDRCVFFTNTTLSWLLLLYNVLKLNRVSSTLFILLHINFRIIFVNIYKKFCWNFDLNYIDI